MLMRKVLLWIFGLVPAVAWLLYTVFFTIMALLAAPSNPLLAVIYAAVGALIIWGLTTIVLLILEKPAKNAKYALLVIVVALVPIVLGGLSAGENNIDDVLLYLFIDVDLVYHFARLENFFGGDH